jgi:glycosyltransferase involved in cell wall biosynthesis
VICSPLRERAIRLGVPAETILHVPNGCDIQNIFPVPIIEARRRLGLPIDGIIVGYMGASFKADVGLMNAAFSALKKQFPEISFLWVGARPEAAAKVLDGKDGIIVVPSFKERHLNDYLASFDICWLPLQNSLANAGRWPLKLNDYLAAGKPIVATRVGDMETLVEQNEVGLAAEVTPESLAACTARLVMDSDLRAAMGQRSRALAEQRFRWEDLTREVRNYYMLAVARRNADR